MSEPFPAPGESAQPGPPRRMPPDPRPPEESRYWGWVTLLAGLALYTLVQGLLVWVPLWTRDLPPEVDDSLAYLVRTRQMEECFFQDCPALLDLKEQRQFGLDDPKVLRAHELSSFPFPFYHPLFSFLILGAKSIPGDYITAYKVVWSLSPLLFACAFACLLSVLWGKHAAGIALGILAFKIFPDTGLHYFTPSNLAMGLAVFMWARLISRKGDAPWTLILFSMLLILTHPIGAVYVVMAMTFSAASASGTAQRRVRLTLLTVPLVSILGLCLASLLDGPPLIHIFKAVHFVPSLTQFVTACSFNIKGIVLGISRLKESLFGDFALFLSAAILGFVLTPSQHRRVLWRVIFIYSFVLILSLYPTHAVSPPGDIFFRLWIPLVAIIFGAVGMAAATLAQEALRILRDGVRWDEGGIRTILAQSWPLLLLGMLAGYSGGTALKGGEDLYTLGDHMRNRQALKFDAAQVESVLSQTGQSDRILYTSIIPMQFYFAEGAMLRGAVHYHASYAGSGIESEWLNRPDLRFAVTYNPLVYHPLLDGLDEKDQCISSPEYRFSALSKPRRHSPILQEGFIHLQDFKWLGVRPSNTASPRVLRIFVRNGEGAADLEVVPVDAEGCPRMKHSTRVSASPHWAGWLHVDLKESCQGCAYRIVPPKHPHGLALGGISFDESRLHWPWDQKAELTLFAKDPATGLVNLIFDPATLVPSALAERQVSIIDDSGSSVLLGIGP